MTETGTNEGPNQSIDVGMQINFESELDLNMFVHSLASALGSRLNPKYPDLTGTIYGSQLHTGRPRRFLGDFSNIRVIIVPPDLLPIKDKTKVDPDTVISFRVDRDMISTGRGKVGNHSRLYSLYVRQVRVGGAQEDSPRIMISSKDLDPKKTSGQVQSLVNRSSSIWREVYINALKHMASAGLPTLGKRN